MVVPYNYDGGIVSKCIMLVAIQLLLMVCVVFCSEFTYMTVVLAVLDVHVDHAFFEKYCGVHTFG